MPEGVRRDALAEAGAHGRATDDRPGLLPSQPATVGAQEERAAPDRRDVVERQPGRSDRLEVADQPGEGLFADRDEPLAVALADDPHEGAVEREVVAVEAERLADPQPGGVEELEEGPVADVDRVAGSRPTGGLEDRDGLGDVERLGQAADGSRAGRSGRRGPGR